MRIATILMALSAAALSVSPAVAATAPAASLSVAKSVRAGTTTTRGGKVADGGILALAIAAGVAAIGVVAIVNDDDSDSN